MNSAKKMDQAVYFRDKVLDPHAYSRDKKDPHHIVVGVAKLSGMVIMGTLGNMTCQEW